MHQMTRRNNILTFTFDAVGNLTQSANNAGTYTMAYDAINRMTLVNEPFELDQRCRSQRRILIPLLAVVTSWVSHWDCRILGFAS